jgi:hypothetical protein
VEESNLSFLEQLAGIQRPAAAGALTPILPALIDAAAAPSGREVLRDSLSVG